MKRLLIALGLFVPCVLAVEILPINYGIGIVVGIIIAFAVKIT